MSFKVIDTIQFPQPPFQHLPPEIIGDENFEDLPVLGAILSDLKHVWQAKGPCLEIRNVHTGRKVGSWIFGGILNDSNTKVVAVDEVKRSQGRLSFLIVGLECSISGGLICVFDVFGSKVLRVIQVKEQITSLYVVDSGISNIPDPSPLKYFDGVVAIGTSGGNVYLLDLCQQICENALHNTDSISVRDELNPCQMVVLKKEKIENIKKYVQHYVEKEEHLAINLNVVVNPLTDHFILKGEKGDDRVHVNREEAQVSSLFYSPCLASLLVGYNFGAFQLWDLRSLSLIYTSPICEEHIPITRFTVQEPADDPKAYCYIWVSYSHDMIFHSGFPFAVMYSFYYDTKRHVNNYGHLYENFQHCSVRFQIELGEAGESTYKSRVKGGSCIGLHSLHRGPVNKDLNSLSLCLISWFIWNTQREIQAFIVLFDLNQWYKEQMPSTPNWSECSNYIIKQKLEYQLFDVKLDPKSLDQFIGVQRLEEHYCPTSLSFDLWCLTQDEVLKVYNKGLQKTLIDKIESSEQLCLLKPDDFYDKIINIGLMPLFCEISHNLSQDIDYQREIIFNVALEHNLIGWLCQTCTKTANNSLNSCGLTLFYMMKWAFQRAVTLKNSCDSYCVPLFDYSGSRLDNNTIALINSGTSQLKTLCTLYRHISTDLKEYVMDRETLIEERHSLENVVLYFEVLLWMVNIGLLPEFNPKKYRALDSNYWSAPYLAEDLTEFYNKKRAQLQLASHDTFVEKDCLLFIDNLINNKNGVESLRQKWQEDGGSGMYPAPSLQSILSIYLLEGTDTIFKHCLVTYTLLDIATTVDEDNKVIKLLLKFPQIFDLSQSNIKIVQAFWHLDHDDYETALEYILDPCVLAEDLQHWHHSVMMRSLLLQEQFNLALVYLQIRKPAIQDEKDLFTVVSLLVSKNMLDEAFKFKHQHQTLNEHTLLMHIFNECNKTESLHSLLYRCLTNDEERAFFKYLQSTKSPRCEDLKLFYFLLRSRFLEAFDTYSCNKRTHPQSQGLIGQKEASTADNIIKMFKTLLPDVNRNLVDLVRKERSNLWKEVRKPVPLSVFVHNARDQVQCKSSVIFAALSKAKQTFNDTANDNKMNNEVLTEETPFLRTPCTVKQTSRIETPLIKSKIIEQDEFGEEYGAPSPCKRLKLSPRASKISPSKSINTSSVFIHSKLSTPIVKRRKFSFEQDSCASTILPQSILKGSSRTIIDDSILNESTAVNVSAQIQCENSFRNTKFGLTPRKPISKTPQKSHVKFDDLRYSNSSTEQRSLNESTVISPPEVPKKRLSNNSSDSTIDEVFLSPESSFEINDKNVNPIISILKETRESVREKLTFDDTEIQEEEVIKPKRTDDKVDTYMSLAENDLSTNRLTFQSPKSRRSYKRSFSGSPVPVRSSPRLTKKDHEDSTSAEVRFPKPVSEPLSPILTPKVKARRSLSRAVLENNAYSAYKTSYPEKTRKSSVYSASSSASETFSDSLNLSDSLDTFLQKMSSKGRSNISLNDSTRVLFDQSKSKEQGEIISKTTETKTTEVRRESLRSKLTNDTISTKEFKQEHESKTIETFGDQKHELKTTVTENKTILEENIEESDVEELDILNISDDYKMELDDALDEVSSQRADTFQDDALELNVFEDLSSGSEDIKQVLPKNQDKTEKTYADISFSTSRSYTLPELEMPVNIMASDESNDGEKICEEDFLIETHYTKTPEPEKETVNAEPDDVIEINSSSEEDEAVTTKDTKNSPESSVTESSDPSTDSSDVEPMIIESDINEEDEKTQDVEDPLKIEISQEEIEPTRDDALDAQNVEDPLRPDINQVEMEKTEIDLAVKAIEDDHVGVKEIEDDHVSVKEIGGSHVDQGADDEEKIDISILPAEGNKEHDTLEQIEIENADVHQDKVIESSSEATPEQSEKRDQSIQTTVIKEVDKENIELDKLEYETTPQKNIDEGLHKTLLLRTVKKTYSLQDRINATPKVNVNLIERVYSRKGSESSTINITDKSSNKQKGDEQEMEAQATTSDESIQLEGKEHFEFTNQEADKSASNSDQNVSLGPMTRSKSHMIAQLEGHPSEEIPKSVEETVTSTSHNSSHSSGPETPRSRRVTRRILQLGEEKNPQEPEGEGSVLSGKTSNDNKSDSHETESPESKSEQELRKVHADIAKLKKRLRSVSVDQPPIITIKKKTTRSKSIDLDHVSKHESLKVNLVHIDENPEFSDDGGKHTNKATSDVGGYTTSRRLTRRQASMLKSIGTVKEHLQNLPNLEEIDPIHLLDKPHFEGEVDTSESRVYEPSSPSGSIASAGPSRHTRSASVLSDVAPSTPTKRARKSQKDIHDVPTSGIKYRLRRQSVDTASVASEQSDSPSPSKRPRKKETDDETHPEIKSAKKGRSRSSSVSSVKSHLSDAADTSVKTRSRRAHSVINDLPEIQEENTTEEASASTKRGGREKKH